MSVAVSLLVSAGVGEAWALCGDYDDSGAVTASDALGVLRTAVGQASCSSYSCDIDDNGAVTASDALGVLKRAVGQSVAMSCPFDPDCQTDIDFFFERIWTPILTDCIGCHNPNGLASGTDHVLHPSSEPGYVESNFEVLHSLWENGKGDLLLDKPLGHNHGGGRRLQMTTESTEYLDMSELLARFESPIADCGGSPASFFEGVTYLDDLDVLRKAALLFAGRVPTAGEESAVSAGGESALRETIRGLMSGADFERFLMESANDRLLTDKFLNWGPSSFDILGGDYNYPQIYERIEQIRTAQGDDAAWWATVRTNIAITQEPLRLISHVVTLDRPYSEVLTADYIMVNPWSAPGYQAGVSFSDQNDDEEWREGTNNGYRVPGDVSAGLLSSPIFLGRYPSTATNRNRARARWAYYYFLGVDIEALAQRPIDPDALADDGNPTMDNPHCAVCHQVHDPVAGTFQNYGDSGWFREFDTDSLPWSYKETDLYEWGDLWYRDMRKPGFNNVVMPASRDDDSIRWLAEQMTADPRFADGAVKFWFPSVLGGKPLAAPVESSDANYRTRLRAWAAQDDAIRTLAASFRDGSAGTGEHGELRLKDMLVEMVMTPAFRADAVTGLDEDRADELAEVGSARLLTPEQLDRKLISTTGYRWAPLWDPDSSELVNGYKLFYGGIDSDGVTARATELNSLMSTVIDRMANEAACPITVADFSKPAGSRLLFGGVEPDDTPDTQAGENAIRATIVHLHERMLGERLSANDPEVDRTLSLFEEIRQLRNDQDKTHYLPWPAYCQLDFDSGTYIENDAQHTIRGWIAVINYLLGDYRFVHE